MPNDRITKLTVGPVATNCWIYRFNDGSAAIIDPGDEADKIISVLLKSSLTPKYILLTHGHFDHICAVPNLVTAFHGKITLAIHKLDSEYLGPKAYNIHRASMKKAMGNTALLDVSWSEMPSPDVALEEGSVIGSFTVLHLPGHTPGSAAFWDRETGVLFSGDTLFSGAYGRFDLPGGDKKQLFTSLRRLFDMDEYIKVYPGHGEETTIGQEC
jgi:glyoxylase-like metal-dependent hydrolase (beta-lactamase superfamily II)